MTIVMATDFSACADAALRWALDLAASRNSDLVVVHVVPLSSLLLIDAVLGPSPADMASLCSDATRRLERLSAACRRLATPPVKTEVRTGDTARGILEAARDHAAELVVMGTHGRSGLPHLVLGSVAEQVLRGSPCPVLAVPLRELR
jgi:nucleotide-binding universal stress UspA family protein